MFIVLAYYNIYPTHVVVSVQFHFRFVVFRFSSKCLSDFWYVENRDGTRQTVKTINVDELTKNCEIVAFRSFRACTRARQAQKRSACESTDVSVTLSLKWNMN